MNNDETIKIYVCCPNGECTAYKDALNFLKSYGIEPNIGCDETGHYFEIIVPDDPKFNKELKKRSKGFF